MFEVLRHTEPRLDYLERSLSAQSLESTVERRRIEEHRALLLQEEAFLLERQKALERLANDSQLMARSDYVELKKALTELQAWNKAEISRLDASKRHLDDELRRIAAERQGLSGPAGQLSYRLMIAPMQESELDVVLQRNQGAIGFEQPPGSGNLVLFRRDLRLWVKVGNGTCQSLLCLFGPETDDIRQLRQREDLPTLANVVYAFPPQFQQILLSRISEKLRGSPTPLQPVLVLLVFSATDPSGLEIKEIRQFR